MIPDIKPELNKMIQGISIKPMYYGNQIPSSIMSMFVIEETANNAGVLVPSWISVLQVGRGPWRGSNIGKPLLRVKIYNWMKKHNLFKSETEAGRRGEAFVIARYINKYGNAHFRSGRFVDIYKTEREKAIIEIERKFSLRIGKITTDVI